MASETPATRMLVRAGVPFTLHRYAYDPAVDSIGLAAAAALGEDPALVLKTLMVKVDGRPACAILASDRTLAMKRVAAAAGGKAAAMMPPTEAERHSGYRIGGISPLGQRKPALALLDAAAMAHPLVYVNGGERGLQLRLAPADLLAILSATAADLAA